MTKLKLLILFIFSILFCNAQYSIKDSLDNVLSKTEISNRAEIYNNFAFKIRNTNPGQAEKFAKSAVENAEKYKNYRELARAYGIIGVSYRNRRNFDEAQVYYQKGLDIAIENNEKEQEGYAYVNFGNWNIYTENYKKAIEYLLKALKIAEELSNDNMLAYCNLNLGRAHLERDEKDISFKYLKKALEIRIRNKDKAGMAVCYKYMADAYMYENKLTKADSFYNIALKNADKKFDKDLLSYIYSQKAEFYLSAGKLNEAKNFADLSVRIAEKTKNLARKKGAYLTLVNVYKALKNHIKVSQYQDSVLKFSEELYNHKLKITSSSFLFDQKQKENRDRIDKLEQEQEFSKTESRLQRLILGLVIVIAIVLIIANITRKKKNRLLSKQKSEIEKINTDLNAKNEEIRTQRDEIEKQHNAIEKQQIQITDSILYAERIQKAALPHVEDLANVFPENFILFKPRDIVSGDFYWFKNIGGKIVITVADCTGHGVPGAFVSMLGMSLLNEIVIKQNIFETDRILEELRDKIKDSLRQNNDVDSQDDGMDMVLCVIDTKTYELQFSGANNPLFIFRNEELIVLKPTSNPVGIYFREIPFEKSTFQLQEGDTIYMFSDGYIDQFGGPDDRRFMTRNFKTMLKDIQGEPIQKQKYIINKRFEEWKGKRKQIDDILVMGIKVK